MPSRRQAPPHTKLASLLAALTPLNVTRKSPGVTSLPARALSVLLAVVMLANSTPAAPRVLADAGRGWGLNALLWFQASGWAATLQALGQNRPPAQRQERQSEREARVRRVEIRPGELEVTVGERVQFTAVAYDWNDDPVGGIRFSWRGRDEGRGRLALVTREGLFEARAAGNFKVFAEGAGRQAHVKVRVREGERRRHDEQPRRLRDISTDDSPAEAAWAKPPRRGETARRKSERPATPAKFAKASFNHAPGPATPTALLLDDEYGWNSGNYMYARDPDNGRGDPPGRPIDDGSGNGNFQFAAPVLSLPGRGIDLSLALVYNSRVWTKTGNQIIFDADRDWPAPGWSLGFGRVVGMGAGGSLIIDPDGTRHGFTSDSIYQYSTGAVSFTGHTTDGTFIDYRTYSTSAGIQRATAEHPNGTVLQYGAPGGGAVYPTSITDANGNYVTITYRNNAGPQIDVVTDTLGRTVKFHYDVNNLLTAVEGPGLGGTSASPARRTLVRLHYRQLTLDYNNFSVTPVVRSGTVWVPDAIYYPGSSTGYWFGEGAYSTYGMLAKVVEQRGMGFSGAPPTEMGAVTPGQTTREQIYDYPLTPNQAVYLSDAPTYSTLTEKWTTDGTNTEETTTTYSVEKDATNPSFPTVPSRKVEITQASDGVRSVQYSYNYTNLASTHPDKFKDGLVYHDETRDANGNLLSSSVVTDWHKGAYDSPRPVRTEVTDDRGQKTAAEFTYGAAYNQVEEVRDFGYGGASLLRITRTTYENSPNYTSRHIFNLVKAVEVYEPDGVTRLSRAEYQYDGGTLADTPDVVMHAESHNPYAPQYEQPCDCENVYTNGYEEYVCRSTCLVTAFDPSTSYRGNVTQVTTYAGGVNLSGALTETRAYDRTGNLITASSFCCEQTGVTYTVDTQYAYPTTQTQGAATNAGPRVTTSASYDFNTGLVKTSTDANGRTAQSFYYQQTLRPQAVYAPTNARTEYDYDDAQMTVTETTYTAENAPAQQSIRRLNGNGQVRREEARGKGANVWDVVETRYDAFGRVKEQSRPFRDGAETPRWNKTFYDVLGRVTRAEAPDGSATESFYNEASYPPAATQGQPGQTVRVRDAWGRERWGRTDAQGRLVEVVEPDPYGGGSVFEAGALLTRYGYDTPGNLVEVAQGEQVRRFRYDSLGRLTHQKLAETTATINDAGQFVGVGGAGAAWGDYFTYDGRSNLVTRTDARGIVTNFSYAVNNQPDPLNRLQSVSYTVPAGSNIPAAAAVSYVYETDAAKDRTRVRQIVAGGVSAEALDYDSEGRLHERTLTLEGRASYPFTTNYTYDSLDRVTDVTYPAQYGVAGSPRKVVHHDFDAASRLSGLTVNNVSHASEIGYNASSQTTSLKVGAAGANQMTESYAYDPLTGLLAGQKVFRGTDTAENRRLDLSYDYLREGTAGGRTGHLTKVTDNRDAAKSRHYEYDPVGRLRRASAGASAGSWAQRYLYDRYGNRSHVLSQKASDWVTALYNVTLNRAPDAGGLATWDNVLRQAYAQGQAAFLQAAKDTASGFFDSTEYANRNRSNSDYVRDLYLAYLNREPDAPGWAAWTNALDGGATRQGVRQGFADSGEFANRVSGMYPGAAAAGGSTAAPSSLSATENAASQVKLNWAAPASGTVSHYRVERKASAAGQYAPLTTTTNTEHTDTQVSAEAAYLYRVSAVYADGSVSGASNAALGTAVKFTDDPVEAGVTTVMARHLEELRRAVNAVRRLAGLEVDAPWTDAAEAGVVVRAQHVRELRQRLGEALSALQLPAPSYSGGEIEERVTVIRAAHFNELRRAAGRAVGAGGGGGGTVPAAPAAPRDGHAFLSFDPHTNRVNSPGWEYDAAGNQTRIFSPSGTWQRMEYDAANRLVRVKADDNQTVLASYTYGDSNQRLVTEEGGARTYYAAQGGQVLAEYAEYGTSTAPQWAKSYVYLGGRLLSTFAPISGGEVVEHHHPDRLGTRLVTRPADGSSFEQAHLPFGNGVPSESVSSTNRRFTSYDRSGATGLDYAVNRRYDPVQGRFTQADPIEMEAVDLDDPQSLNLYAYCANDPVNYTDPDGLFVKKLFKAIWKVLTNRWFVIAATVALTVISVGAAAGLWSLTTTVMQTAVLHGYTISLGVSQVSALGWVAAGLTTALAVPGLTSLKGLLRNAVSFGVGQAFSQGFGGLRAAVGAGGTPDWNPDSNEFARRRDRRPPLRRGQPGYRGPGSWHYGLGWHRSRIPISRQLLPGKHVKHHLFPQRADLANEFARRGIDIHQYTMVLPENVHQRLHRGGPRGGQWNQEWENFFRENPNATREQVFRHAGALIHRHGLVQPYPIVPYR